jgi:transcriptional regulator
MYVPKHFESPDRALTLEAMRRYNFATIFSNDNEGEPIASHVPVVVEEGDPLRVHFHFARANPHVNVLRETKRAMVAFLGPHAYMSPTVYPDLKRVPTWNYIAVHAYGDVVELDGNEAKDSLLKSLIDLHEPPYAEQWRDLDADFQNTLLNAIVAFRLDVTKLDSKFKLNQHRKESHASMKASYARGNENERELAQWMERIGL